MKPIPVTESLPELEILVLVFVPNGSGTYCPYIAARCELETKKDYWWELPNNEEYFTSDEVSHWLPIPEVLK